MNHPCGEKFDYWITGYFGVDCIFQLFLLLAVHRCEDALSSASLCFLSL